MVDHADIDHTGLFPAGTSFPGTPADNDLFQRTDRDLLYFYDGAQWLTMTLYEMPLAIQRFVQPLSASGVAVEAPVPHTGVYSVWAEDFAASFLVNSGGTALGASHKWVLELYKSPADALLATINIASGASGAWRDGGVVAIDAVISTAFFNLYVSAIKTGTPGTLMLLPVLRYRLIG